MRRQGLGKNGLKVFSSHHLSFGIANAILLEALLTFLGVGLPPQTVSWGTLLQSVRANFDCWWLAIFPGLAIFFTVYTFNRLGELIAEE